MHLEQGVVRRHGAGQGAQAGQNAILVEQRPHVFQPPVVLRVTLTRMAQIERVIDDGSCALHEDKGLDAEEFAVQK